LFEKVIFVNEYNQTAKSCFVHHVLQLLSTSKKLLRKDVVKHPAVFYSLQKNSIAIASKKYRQLKIAKFWQMLWLGGPFDLYFINPTKYFKSFFPVKG